MFFIVNKSRNELTIGDLNLSLGPNQAVDLDKIYSRSKSENSENLHNSIKRGLIQVKQKTETRHAKKEKPKEEKSFDIESFKEDIKKEIRNELKNIPTSSNLEILQAIEKIKDAVSQGNISYNKSDTKQVYNDDNLDENHILEIHTRAANKIAKDTESRVSYEEEDLSDDIDSAADELDGLL